MKDHLGKSILKNRKTVKQQSVAAYKIWKIRPHSPQSQYDEGGICMIKRLQSALGGGGFYVVLAACVLAAGIGGYFLLTGGAEETAPLQEPEEEPTQTEAVSPVTDLPVQTEETIQEPEPEEEPQPAAAVSELVDDTPVAAAVPKLVVAPLKGEVLTAFSVDQLVYSETLGDWRTHDGMDIAADAGTKVLAASGGKVISVTEDALMGTTVVLDHGDGYQTTYASLQAKPTVAKGDTVTAGQVIGAVGATAAAESAQGPHLHFAVSKDGDAVDPEAYLNK